MKVLVVSNFYPPRFYGGYEIGCAQVCDYLRDHGVDVQVLTSRWNENVQQKKEWILPVLEDQMSSGACHIKGGMRFVRSVGPFRRNVRTIFRQIEKYRPDIVYLWNLSYLGFSLGDAIVDKASYYGYRTVFFIFDYAWRLRENDVFSECSVKTPSVIKNMARKVVRQTALAGIARSKNALLAADQVQFASSYLQQYYKGLVEPTNGVMVNWGVKTENFIEENLRNDWFLLYAGQLTAHKGVHTLIRSLGMLKDPDLHLSIVGGPQQGEYFEYLRRLIDENSLSQSIVFHPQVRHEEMGQFYREHGILIFPSEWAEPLGMTVLEAMASGCCVITSGTGGGAELVQDGVTGCLFRAGDAADLAMKMRHLVHNKELLHQLASQGRETVFRERDFKQTGSLILNLLNQCMDKRL